MRRMFASGSRYRLRRVQDGLREFVWCPTKKSSAPDEVVPIQISASVLTQPANNPS